MFILLFMNAYTLLCMASTIGQDDRDCVACIRLVCIVYLYWNNAHWFHFTSFLNLPYKSQFWEKNRPNIWTNFISIFFLSCTAWDEGNKHTKNGIRKARCVYVLSGRYACILFPFWTTLEKYNIYLSFKNIRHLFGVRVCRFCHFERNSFVLFSAGWQIRNNNNTLLLFNLYYYAFFMLISSSSSFNAPQGTYRILCLLVFVWFCSTLSLAFSSSMFFVHFLECTDCWSLFLIPFNIRLQYKFKRWIQ